MPRRSVSPYTDTQIGEALTCHALASGNLKRCDEYMALRKLPKRLKSKLVSDWACRTKRELYEKIRASVEDHVHAQLAEVHFEMASTMTDLEREAAEKLRHMLQGDEMDGKELGNVLRSASISSGIHTQRGMELRGKPTQIIQHDFADITRILEQQHGIRIAAGTQPSVSVVDTKELEPA